MRGLFAYGINRHNAVSRKSVSLAQYYGQRRVRKANHTRRARFWLSPLSSHDPLPNPIILDPNLCPGYAANRNRGLGFRLPYEPDRNAQGLRESVGKKISKKKNGPNRKFISKNLKTPPQKRDI